MGSVPASLPVAFAAAGVVVASGHLGLHGKWITMTARRFSRDAGSTGFGLSDSIPATAPIR